MLQRRMFDGGFAGICFPPAYRGLGLRRRAPTRLHRGVPALRHAVLAERSDVGILAATLVDFGTHQQKLRHLPAILRGEELWVQFLSEPSGGSDLAGVLTRAC